MASSLRRTPLHDRHVALGAKLGGFAGWDMPLEYTTVRDEHRAVRGRAGVFDVSHMGQIEVGARRRRPTSTTLTNDIGKLRPAPASTPWSAARMAARSTTSSSTSSTPTAT